jgi:hypothetical protein
VLNTCDAVCESHGETCLNVRGLHLPADHGCNERNAGFSDFGEPLFTTTAWFGSNTCVYQDGVLNQSETDSCATSLWGQRGGELGEAPWSPQAALCCCSP